MVKRICAGVNYYNLIFILISLFMIFPICLFSQELKEMQFINQPITDILLALGEISGKSIIPDETVKGSASYYFVETDFETAFEVFLETNKMYYRKENSIYYVSRIRTEYDYITNTISMDAEDVEFPFLVRAASKAIGKTILHDPLPAAALTIHVVRVSPEKLLSILIKKYPEFELEVDQDYYYVKNIPKKPLDQVPGKQQVSRIEKKGNLYTINLEKARFLDIIDQLFIQAGYEYSSLIRKDSIIEKLRFKDKRFERILRLILEQVNADYTRIGEIYYIFEIQQKDILKKLDTTIRIPLVYISAKELTNLFPVGMISSQIFKLDVNTNSIILSGSLQEIGPVQEFIKKVDQPVKGQEYFLFDVNYLDVAKIKSVLPLALKHIETVIIPGTNSFVALLPPEKKEILAEYLRLIDIPTTSTSVKLKYIQAEELLKKLPPSISKDDIIETRDPSIIFIRTSPQKLEDFYRELRILDKPIPQIRYQLLVIQYQEGEAVNWSDSLEYSSSAGGAQTAFVGTIGKLLSLNFDIVSTFGDLFALKLNLDLSINKARVLADTTLLGLSGQDIKFQNTETYRYREVEIDVEGVARYTGVTREITAGLIFEIKGWVSGDGMITMDVKATVSKRGTDVSQETGSLPTTSENVINTHTRTLAGKPVVIGGLVRQEKSLQVTKLPILGHIPVLGYLFQSRKESIENSEFVIYIVPHIDYSEVKEAAIDLQLERLYKKFLNP